MTLRKKILSIFSFILIFLCAFCAINFYPTKTVSAETSDDDRSAALKYAASDIHFVGAVYNPALMSGVPLYNEFYRSSVIFFVPILSTSISSSNSSFPLEMSCYGWNFDSDSNLSVSYGDISFSNEDIEVGFLGCSYNKFSSAVGSAGIGIIPDIKQAYNQTDSEGNVTNPYLYTNFTDEISLNKIVYSKCGESGYLLEYFFFLPSSSLSGDYVFLPYIYDKLNGEYYYGDVEKVCFETSKSSIIDETNYVLREDYNVVSAERNSLLIENSELKKQLEESVESSPDTPPQNNSNNNVALIVLSSVTGLLFLILIGFIIVNKKKKIKRRI